MDFLSIEFFAVLLVFIAFIFFVKRVFSVLMGLIWIAIIGGLFPIVMNFFFKWPDTVSIDVVFFYAGLGVAVYLVYLLAQFIYSLLTVTEKAVGKAAAPVKRVLGKKKEEKE